MSTKKEYDESNWETDQDYIRLRREQDDQRLQAEYHNQDANLRQRLAEHYNRKSVIENDLGTILHGIQRLEMEQAHLRTEFDTVRRQTTIQREKEDRDREARWAKYQAENAAANNTPGSAKSTNGHRSSNRDGGNQQSNGGGGWNAINGRGRKSAARDDDEELPTDPGNLLSSGYQPADDSESNGRPMAYRGNGVDMDLDDGEVDLPVRVRKHDEQRPLKPKQRHSLPGFPSDAGRIKQDTPIESKPRSPSGRRSLPGARSHANQDPAAAAANQQEINRDTLLLKHNGKIYTEPPIMYGVPLERIGPDHEYWDPEWSSLIDKIKPELETWKQKLEALRQDKTAVRHTVFLANRQVNRGQAIIDFMEGDDPEFHPYQYVGKEMMGKFYKTFINYDTMFRLVNIHEELKKFDLDVTPLEWLRQRMHEVSLAQGDKFSLSKYTHDLYHDAKLKILREKHGFGNIGRPSGYKVGEKNPDKGKAKLKRESMGIGSRRKPRRSIGQVDMDDSATSMDGYQTQPQEYLEPVTPRLQKRQRLEAAPVAIKPDPELESKVPNVVPVVDELEYEGYTSTDSFSAGRISHLDWRVNIVKTSQLTTSEEVSQYWTWEWQRNTFQHQVLRDVHPKVTWGVYQKPINFDIKLDEVKEVHWSPESHRVRVTIDDPTRGGQLVAYFKRERSKKRFLSFMRKKSVTMVKVTPEQLEDAWNSVRSETLAGGEDDV